MIPMRRKIGGVTSQEASQDSFFTAVSVLDSLIRAGMRQVVVAPGSRSAPLAYALAAAARSGVLDVTVRLDERSAGFTALGMAKACGTPVGVVTTSGTAVGELMPAVMEANHAQTPLAVLSADRPPRLRGTGANQTTWQPEIFGAHVRAAADLTSYPEEEPATQTAAFNDCLAALTGRDPRDWGAASDRPVGPVQINVAFDDPLTPDARMRQILTQWAESLRDLEVPNAPVALDHTVLAALQPSEHSERESVARTVVVAGDGAGQVARAFAEAIDAPLLAEPSSGARGGACAVGAYPLILDGPLGREIEKVVLFGKPTLSRPVQRLLARGDVESIIYLPRPVAWADPSRRAERPVASLAEVRQAVGVCDPSWVQRWKASEAAVGAKLERLIADRERAHGLPSGPGVARTVAQACEKDGVDLVVGSSNLIRDLDMVSLPAVPDPGVQARAHGTSHRDSTPVSVMANRGLAGIDGTLATASGVSLARRAPVRALVGDLTFLHDAGSLMLGSHERIPDVQVVVFNDSGGGIFSTLEHGKVAKDSAWEGAVERFFGTPQVADIGGLTEAYGHSFRRVTDLGELREALREPIEGITVIEVLGTRAGLSEERDRWKDLADTIDG